MLAQKANRSRRYGRIGSVSTAHTEQVPVIMEIRADYPTLNRTDLLYTQKDGVLKTLRKAPLATIHVSSLSQKPFYLYGTFEDRRGNHLFFLEQIMGENKSIPVAMPSSAINPKIHASLTPPKGFNITRLDEGRAQFLRNTALLAKQEPFLNLGSFNKYGNVDISAAHTEPLSPGSSIRYWNGKLADFDLEIHGRGHFTLPAMYSDLWGGDKKLMPYIHAGKQYTRRDRYSADEELRDMFWFVIAEFHEGKGWFVLPQDQPTLKAGMPYCIVGALYRWNDTKGNGGEMMSAGDTEFDYDRRAYAPKFYFMDMILADIGSTRQYGYTDLEIQPWDFLGNGGYVTENVPRSATFGKAEGGYTKDPDTQKVWTNDDGKPYEGLNDYEDKFKSTEFLYNEDGTLTEEGEKWILSNPNFEEPGAGWIDLPPYVSVCALLSAQPEYWHDGKWQKEIPSQKVTEDGGMFEYVFRMPRQLLPGHPQETMEGGAFAIENQRYTYPCSDGSKKGIGFKRIGFETYETKEVNGAKYSYDENLAFDIIVDLKGGMIDTHRSVTVADPDNFAYSTVQDIDRSFYELGKFQHGNHIVFIGKGLDVVHHILVSTKKDLLSIAQSKNTTISEMLNAGWAEQYYSTISDPGILNTDEFGFLIKKKAIKSSDLIDDPSSIDSFQHIFENIFGQRLTIDLFRNLLNSSIMIGGHTQAELAELNVNMDNVNLKFSPLPGQIGEEGKEHLFKTIYDDVPYEHPFSIAIFEIPEGYVGPAPVVAPTLNGVQISDQEAQAIIDAAIPEEIAALDYQHVAGPKKVYYRFSNPLGREKDGGEEDLAAEIEFQLEKKRLGLSRIETFATDDATDFEPEEVELYDAAQQYEEDNLSDDDDDDDGGGSRPLFSLSLPSFPNPFARFKTDNLLRKHTLIPVGSKEKIEEENGE